MKKFLTIPKGRHLLSLKDFNAPEICELLRVGHEIKSKHANRYDAAAVENLERSPEWVSMAVLEALRADLGENFPVESSLAHRWRYASTQNPIGSKYLHNDNRSVWITGDWCLGKGILSAHASALSVVSELRTNIS